MFLHILLLILMENGLQYSIQIFDGKIIVDNENEEKHPNE